MKVWVIMGNDYPAAVRLTKRGADAYVARKKKEDLGPNGAKLFGHPRIYWRHYEFVTPRSNKK